MNLIYLNYYLSIYLIILSTTTHPTTSLEYIIIDSVKMLSIVSTIYSSLLLYSLSQNYHPQE